MANVLGAPTEGLGQNITFAPQEQGSPQLSLDTQAGAVQTGVRGGPAGIGGTQVSGVQAQPYSSPLLDTLLGMAGKAAQARIKEKKTEAYVAGMQRAANGEAIADIAQQQPWYATMFGDTDVVEGARWYASHTIAQEAASGFDEDMHNLRRLGPEQARSEFTSRIQSQLTGDSQTDAAVLQSMTQVMPGIFKRHAKEHMGFLNEEAATAMSASVLAAGRRLQVVAKNRALTPDGPGYSTAELGVTLDQFYKSQTKPPGMTDKTYMDIKVNSLEHMARQGNFHAISALEAGGWVDALPMDKQDAFRAVVAQEQGRAKVKWAANNTEDIARLEVWATEPEAKRDTHWLRAQINNLKEKFVGDTGIADGYFTPTHEAALLSRSAVGIIRAREEEAKRRYEAELRAAEKAEGAGKEEAKYQAKLSYVRDALASGNVAHAMTQPGVSEDMLGHIALSELNGPLRDNPAGRIALLKNIAVGGVRPKAVTQQYEGLIGGLIQDSSQGIMPDRFYTMFKEYSALAEVNTAAADMTFGSYADRFEKMRQDAKIMSPQEAYMGFLRGNKQRAKLDTKVYAKAMDVASKELQPAWAGFSHEMSRASQHFLMSEIEDKTARLVAANHDPETAAKMALKATPEVEALGGHAWRNAPGQTKLMQYLTGTTGPNGKGHVLTDKVADVFKGAMDEKLYGEAGILADTSDYVRVIRLPDQGGIPQFKIRAIVNNGDHRETTLSGAELFDLHHKGEARKKQAQQFPAGVQPNGKPVRDLTRISSFIDFKE